MGVQVRMTVFAVDRPTAETSCRAAYQRIADLEQIMSDYRPTSELMRLCDHAGGPAVTVSADLFTVLTRSQEVARLSNGAFDVTVGPLVKLWREARKTKTLPAADALATARALVGREHVKLDAKTRGVTLALKGMRLDLGGIAKGYALDEAYRKLRAHGIRVALLEAGGDIVAGDPPPGAKGWKIEVVNAPRERRWITLRNRAISSSGDTEQYVEIGGKRYSHIVDPRTGLGLTTRVAATVIAPDGLTSDSLATTACVMDEKRFKPIAKRYRARLYCRTQAPSPLFEEDWGGGLGGLHIRWHNHRICRS